MNERLFHLPLPFNEAIRQLAPAPKVAARPKVKKPEAGKSPRASHAKKRSKSR